MICTRGISLTQPWATLMASSAKMIETRSWKTGYRGWVAIHAAKGFPRACRSLCWGEPFASALVRAGIKDLQELPLGCVIAVTSIVDCRSTDLLRQVAEPERSFGDYGFGRYGFLCRDTFKLRQPFPMKGALGIWWLDRVIRMEDLA